MPEKNVEPENDISLGKFWGNRGRLLN